MDAATQLARSQEIGIKIGRILQRRMQDALQEFRQRTTDAGGEGGAQALLKLNPLADPWTTTRYMIDSFQRSVLFLKTLHDRGNNFVKQAVSGLQPVLHFDYDMIMDGRSFDRPVNYAMLKIKPPEGVTIDPEKRPYVIIDPRAGHGPGIGGFKDDSQVGVAIRAGHPVYFIIFFRDPEPGQTLLDVSAAEQQFIKHVRSLHPKSNKPAIIGNCQGGWAAMMLASSDPDDTGPVIINGAPMSYWGGAWGEEQADNPMRYAGGILGGTWLSSLMADLGNGKFDGAHLVQNFEYLNPANSLWDKYYNLYSNIDTEPPRFLEFERWWGGYYLMNREEIEWITRNLFIGNKLWSGEVKGATGEAFDLRLIKSPIILFSSMGDNITPPQQAFNWVGDLYGSTEEIKARGQVIVGLVHQDVGHLGIFVSGRVAKKEHAQIVSVLDEIELLPPGLYGMHITDIKTDGGKAGYDVEFREYSLEEVVSRLNRFQRVDEKPFEAVVALSDFNQRAYELFVQPFVQATANELSARLLREFHPLRFQNWSMSSLNPWLWWVNPLANAVSEHRQPVPDDDRLRIAEKTRSEFISASLDLYRAVRDAMTEATFFGIYANMFTVYLADKYEAQAHAAEIMKAPREISFVQEALASIAQGGYNEAFARLAYLLSRKGEPLPISQLRMREELIETYADYVPKLPPDEWRRMRGEQEIIARYEPEQAVATLSTLLTDPADRQRILALLDKLSTDERVLQGRPTEEQISMLEKVRARLVERRLTPRPTQKRARPQPQVQAPQPPQQPHVS